MQRLYRFSLIILVSLGSISGAFGQVPRVTLGLQALYGFGEGAGATVTDVSGVGTSLDLTIEDPATVSWIPGGGLDIQASTVINSLVPATKVINAVQSSRAITVETWIEPGNLTQVGPARIFALSQDGYPNGGNFVLGQNTDTVEMRLRTSTTNQYGLPGLVSTAGAITADLVHVIYTRDAAGVTSLYLNGILNASGTSAGDLFSWNSLYTLTVGNEPPGNRPWLGQIYLMAVYDRALDGSEVGQNFAAGHLLSGGGPSVRFVAMTGLDLPGNGAEGNPYRTIQYAINQCSDGDEVRMLPGVYTGPGNRDLDFGGRAILVGSRDEDPATCVINCEGTEAEPHRGFIFQNDEGPESVLVGITITEGYETAGGGILLEGVFNPPDIVSGASPSIRKCNIAANFGGGIVVRGFGHPFLADCMISENTGNGVHLIDASTANLERCFILNNSSRGIESTSIPSGGNYTDCTISGNLTGGLNILNAYPSPRMVRCTIENNTGWGIRFSGDESALDISDSDIVNNTGTGIEIHQPYTGMNISNCRINGNGADGILNSDAFTVNIVDSEIVGNGMLGINFYFSFNQGESSEKRQLKKTPTQIFNCRIGLNGTGGIGGEAESPFSSPAAITIDNCLIYDNRGDGVNLEMGDAIDHLILARTTIVKNDGLGVHCGVGDLVLQNTLVANNGQAAVTLGTGVSASVFCSDFYGNSGGDWTGPVADFLGIDGNITQPPLFCNLNANEFTLLSSSACLEVNQSVGMTCGQIGSKSEGCQFGGTYVVSTTGSDAIANGTEELPFSTIQMGLRVASAGDRICLQPGTYTGPGNRDIDFAGKAVTVGSCDEDPATTIIDCQGVEGDPHRGFIFQAGEDSLSILRDLTITGGYADDVGGGILVGSPDGGLRSAPTIVGCVFTQNTAARGAGIAVYSNPIVRQTRITDNSGSGVLVDYTVGAYFSNCLVLNNSGSGVVFTGGFGADFPSFVNCTVTSNSSHGFELGAPFGYVYPQIEGCMVSSNMGWGVSYSAGLDLVATISGITVTGNGMGGMQILGGEGTTVSGCLFEGNLGPGLVLGHPGLWLVSDCTVVNNRGHGISFAYSSGQKRTEAHTKAGVGIARCDIMKNDGRGIDFQEFGHEFWIDECLIASNGLEGIGVDAPIAPGSGGILNVQYSTVVSNGGAGFSLATDLPCNIETTILADNMGSGFLCTGAETPQLTCVDIWGNLGGDWVDCIAPQLGTDNNISVDPKFCGTDNLTDPYGLGESSVCAAENNPACGQIGARRIGCSLAPVIESVTDIGNDEGGKVRLIWRRCGNDQAGAGVVITGYGVYREQGEYKDSGSADTLPVKAAGWDYVTTVPARQDEVYQYVAPTLCDSTISAGPCLSNYMVSAMTSDPGMYFDSEPVAGYSVDNISPDSPSGLVVAFTHDHNVLSWGPVLAADYSHFLVYRTTPAEGRPGPDTEPLQVVRDLTWTDQLAEVQTASWDFLYWLAAVDSSGNCSSVTGHEAVSDVGGQTVELRTTLYANAPNPFNPRTKISFDLLQVTDVYLVVYDVSGRAVRSLLAGEVFEAGGHEVSWSGRDDRGRQVAAGIYFYQLRANDYSQTRRMTLVK